MIGTSPRLLVATLTTLRRFRAQTQGNVGIMFSLSIVPLLLCVSIAIDFTRASDEKARLDTAADSTALFAVTRGLLTMANGPSSSSEIAASQTYFRAALGALRPGLILTNVDVALVKDPSDPRTLVATVTYGATVDTIFGALYNPTIDVSGTATATASTPSYIDFYLLLDNSPSMGLAATDADIARLKSLTGGCEFACHTIFPDGTSDPNDNLAIAKANGVQLRIDNLRLAVQALTQTALTTERKFGSANLFRMGIYGFNNALSVISGANPAQYTQDYGLTPDLAMAGAAAAGLELTPYRSDGNLFQTNFTSALRTIAGIVSTPGDGTSTMRAKKYVFFVTDGVQDLPLNNPDANANYSYTQYDNSGANGLMPPGWGHALAPVDPARCQSLKDAGVKVAVLYTTFQPTTGQGNPLVEYVINHWRGDIETSLAACASPGLFYAADTTGISAAMARMFQDAIQSARLTQ